MCYGVIFWSFETLQIVKSRKNLGAVRNEFYTNYVVVILFVVVVVVHAGGGDKVEN